MDAMEAIRTRRSVRRYQDRDVPDPLIEQVLAAGMFAPSAGNQQPWHFIVLRDRNLIAKATEIHPHARMALEAPVSILVCADLGLEKYKGYWVQDCSAAVQNILLAAHALGLGAVWTGVHPVEDRVAGFRKLFQLPEGVMPLAFIPLGYPAQEPPTVDRFRPERIHRDRW